MANPAPPPVVCTLTTKALAAQTLEWNDLAPLALSSVALPNGARSTFALEHADVVEDLATREMDCCGSWLDVSATRGDVITLELTTTNPDGIALIHAVAGITA